MFFSLIGLIQFIKKQVFKDKILYSEYINLKVKHPKCQSCGMYLIDDDKFDKESNYCSNCYNTEGFIDKDISLSKFLEKIEEQLLLKGFKESEIKSRLKKVPNLMRWRKKFDWEKTTFQINQEK
ncbi:zinc ribbon domain-containing protein [Aquimarina longa]|uniref:zinc ribbon domain-containing protein n=1 Tax=Aquimarina longa TaxID=1080221 RepID=UPI000780E613|nr:zinc ribbon domain-containing protein [Aquimarina longa]